MSEEAELSDYVRVKRRNTTIFLYVLMSDTARDVRAKISAVNKVSPTDMRLFLDKNGDIPLDEKKSLADQKVENDQELFMVFRKEGSDEWEAMEVNMPTGDAA